MQQSTAEAMGRSAQFINVTFTYTKTDEPKAPYGQCFIDKGGNVYGTPGKQTLNITIHGGDNTSAHMKTPLAVQPFYMTNGQRVALMRILKAAATCSDQAVINSDNGDLLELCYSIYNNYSH